MHVFLMMLSIQIAKLKFCHYQLRAVLMLIKTVEVGHNREHKKASLTH